MQIIFSGLTPILLLIFGSLLTFQLDQTKIEVIKSEAKVKQAELIKSFLEDLSSSRAERQRLAIDAIFFALPYDISLDLLIGFIETSGNSRTTAYASQLIGNPNRSELDVFDEYVIWIRSYEKSEGLFEKLLDLRDAIDSSNYPIWSEDLHIVRDPKDSKKWWIVMDTFTGPSYSDKVNGELEYIKNIYNVSDNFYLQDWFKDASVEEYQSKTFIRTYGSSKIIEKSFH
ncbi:MAG: hypothetical protein ABJI10_04270 [Ekhidna sp.]